MSASDEDLDAFRQCFERNGMPRRHDALRWQYGENPVEKVLVDLAVDGNRVGGIYAVQPARVQIGGDAALAVQSVGFPNGNSAPGFFGKLAWVSLAPVPFLLRPLRTRYFATKLPLGPFEKLVPDLRVPVRTRATKGRSNIVEVREIGSEVDQLWSEFSSGIDVTVVRDARYLRWRLRKPGELYHLIGVEEGGALDALCAFTTVDKHGGRVGYVLELMHRPDKLKAATVLLTEAVRRMAADRADAVLAWCFPHSPNAGAYSEVGFFGLPERFRPIELHVGVRSFDPSHTTLLARRESWYMSYCDSDTV